jgi:hypothetical protein
MPTEEEIAARQQMYIQAFDKFFFLLDGQFRDLDNWTAVLLNKRKEILEAVGDAAQNFQKWQQEEGQEKEKLIKELQATLADARNRCFII